MKKCFGGQRFAKNEEVGFAINSYFEELDESPCKQSIEAIEHGWGKCIELIGDYVEK